MIESKTRKIREKDPIAWIEMESYGDIDEIKQDLRELSERTGFRITRFETEKPQNIGNGNKIVKAYTDSFKEIPENRVPIVREWKKREIFWAQHVCNAGAKIEGENGCKEPTKNISKKEEKNKLSEQNDTEEINSKINEKEEQNLPPSSVKRIENLNFQILEELRKIRESLEDSEQNT